MPDIPNGHPVREISITPLETDWVIGDGHHGDQSQRKFDLDARRLQFEIESKRAELALQNEQLEEAKRSAKGWRQVYSPLGIAIITALFGLGASVYNGYISWNVEDTRQKENAKLEKTKQETAVLQKLLEVADDKQRMRLMLFYNDAKWLTLDKDYRDFLVGITGYDRTRPTILPRVASSSESSGDAFDKAQLERLRNASAISTNQTANPSPTKPVELGPKPTVGSTSKGAPQPMVAGTEGVDSVTDLSGQISCLIKAGYHIAIRSLSPRTTNYPSKTLLLKEAISLSNAGIALVTFWEAGNPTHGDYFNTEQGQVDGKNALQAARAIHQPTGSAIYFAVDFDPSAEEISGYIAPYFRAISQSLNGAGYDIGAYGPGYCLSYLKTAGLIQKGWLAQSRGWAGYADFKPKADIIQGPATTICGLDVATNFVPGQSAGGFLVTK